MSTVSRGNQAERRVAALGREQGFLVASLRHEGGAGDQLWIKFGERGRLIEVKSTPKPYAHFGPKDRDALRRRAAAYDLDPLLAHVRSTIEMHGPETWPGVAAAAPEGVAPALTPER